MISYQYCNGNNIIKNDFLNFRFFLSLFCPIVVSPSIDYNLFKIIIHRVILNMKIGRRSKVYEKMYTIKLILIRPNQTVKHSVKYSGQHALF